ncbi:hypothetical protein V8C26DRAFT_411401 [Trichoderma gracile]
MCITAPSSLYKVNINTLQAPRTTLSRPPTHPPQCHRPQGFLHPFPSLSSVFTLQQLGPPR